MESVGFRLTPCTLGWTPSIPPAAPPCAAPSPRGHVPPTSYEMAAGHEHDDDGDDACADGPEYRSTRRFSTVGCVQ